MRRLPLFLVGLALLATLSGCGLEEAVQQQDAAQHPTVATAAPSAERVVAIPDGVVGTGKLVSRDGKTTGDLTITKTDDAFVLTLRHFTTNDRNQLLLTLADHPVESTTTCADHDVYQTAFGDPIGTHDATFSEQIASVSAGGDPSNLRTFLVVQYPDLTRAPAGSCDQPILALTAITWTLPDTHPDLVVRDSGSRPGAIGTVTVENGEPFTYLTHQGDTWAAIAHRFGISSNDLTYLNPLRLGIVSGNEAYADELLNLSKANRGNSESRHG